MNTPSQRVDGIRRKSMRREGCLGEPEFLHQEEQSSNISMDRQHPDGDYKQEIWKWGHH